MTIDNLKEMMSLQDRLNTHIFPDWRTRELDFGMAIADEAMELAGHIGWKWWKAQPKPNIVQVHLELVDIWHFLLSVMVERGIDDTTSADIIRMFDDIAKGYNHHDELKPVTLAKHLAQYALTPGSMPAVLVRFGLLCDVFRLSFNDLYDLYKAKATLNLFRWDNGYREGTYIKTWFGEEDNVYLEKMIAANPNADAAELTTRLTARYLDVTRGAYQ